MAWFPCLIGSGGGGSTLITKNITQNGIYNASSDNADGYSQVTVNVSGGGRDTFAPQYTETKILDNSSGSTTTITFDEDWHNYALLRFVGYNTSTSTYYSFFATPEGIDYAFTYSQNRFNINQVKDDMSATNQYATYQQNNTFEWQRTNTRNMYLYEVYGITFTNCALVKTEIYNRQGIAATAVTPTPLTGTTFLDYDLLIYMSCTSDKTETQFGPYLIAPPKVYCDNANNFVPFYRYNNRGTINITPTDLGTQQYFYICGLKFTEVT